MKTPTPDLGENLDCYVDPSDLRSHAHSLMDSQGKCLPRIPRAYVQYAMIKASAMEARLRGDISTALRFEADCDVEYARIPIAWKW